MRLGLHFVGLIHGQQSVEVLGLRAHIVKKASCKSFWILKARTEEHRITKHLLFETESRLKKTF